MGDNVRIRATEDTERSGHARRVGTCYGFTTPSVTLVAVIGGSQRDLAYNVGFEGSDAWFAPELVEVVDRAEGSEIRIGHRRFVRSADGEWDPA